jgi:glutamine synthetase
MSETENKEENVNEKVSIIKILYLWQDGNDHFNSRNKIIRTVDKNVKLNVLTTYNGVKELLLKPRFVSKDPFKNDDSLIVMCDVFGSDGQNLNVDKRIDFIKKLEEYKSEIEESEPRFSFIVKVEFQNVDNDVKLNDMVETLVNVSVKGKVNISQYYLENGNTVVFENEFNEGINCTDEFTFFKYILERTSKILNFEYKIVNNFGYKLLNKKSNTEGGIEELKLLSDKLQKINVIIPESIERMGQGYLIDNSFKNDVDIYHNFTYILDSLYK